ncbi:MAG: peptidase MA family metallohydrolase [Anaerolineales bacterium]|nr:peptidase MA family metallohydrolase [Anaerolineales bacterium]
MKRNLIIIILLVVMLIPYTIQAQSGIEVLGESVEYTFGEELVFQIDLESEAAISQITLVLQAPDISSFVGEVTLISPGKGQFVYDLSQRPLPAFANITYSYHVVLEIGESFETPPYSFTYLDNRHNWQELIDEPFRIYWYEGEITLAQEVLDSATRGLEQVLELLQQPEENQPIVIFVYSSEEELQSTLASVGQTWIGGHADPGLGSVVVSLPPGVDQSLEIQRLIPHEITHILLYRFMGAEYQYLPAWFSEGLASQMEFYSRPDYELILEKANGERGLIPFPHICVAFPADTDLALLSYAQSDSLLDYIQREYGVAGLQAMIYAYDQGVSCERGVEVALGITLEGLEKAWKQDVFSRGTILMYIYILIGILLVLLIFLGVFIFSKFSKENRIEQEWDNNE